MKKRYIGLIAITLIAAIVFLVFFYMGKQSSNVEDKKRDVIGKEKSYSSVDVAHHGSRDDCWTIIRGNVYNLTTYISRHPGGDEILRACGNDATSLFESRKNEDGEAVGSGTPHSNAAREQLKQLKIGTVK